MTDPASRIRVKAMLLAVSADGLTHAVSVCPPSAENPLGYHRLIGGSVEFGESHREAVQREVAEELGATVLHLRYVGVVENLFIMEGEAGHEIVFVYSGQLAPEPAEGAVLTESDGTLMPVHWRPFADVAEVTPLYPVGAIELFGRGRP